METETFDEQQPGVHLGQAHYLLERLFVEVQGVQDQLHAAGCHQALGDKWEPQTVQVRTSPVLCDNKCFPGQVVFCPSLLRFCALAWNNLPARLLEFDQSIASLCYRREFEECVLVPIGVFLETCALFWSRLLYPVLCVDALDVINHCSFILKHFPTISTWERLSSGVDSCMAFNCLIDISFGITVSTRNS